MLNKTDIHITIFKSIGVLLLIFLFTNCAFFEDKNNQDSESSIKINDSKIYDTINDFTQFPKNISIDSLNNLAIEKWQDNDYQESLNLTNLAYKKSKEEGKQEQLAKVLNTLGLIYWRLGNNEDAMESYAESGKIAEKLKLYRLLGLTHTNRGLILKEKGDYEKALFHNNIAVSIFEKNNYFKDLAIALNNQGQIFKNQNKFETAENFYLKALANYEKVDYKDGEAATYYNLSDIYLRQGLKEKALAAAENSLKLGLEINRKVRISEAYEKMSECYELMGNPNEALKYYKLYTIENDSIIEINQSKILAQYQAEMGAELKNLQIQNLQKEKKLAANKVWFFGIGLGMLLLVSSFIVYRYFSKMRYNKRKLELELIASNKILTVKELELKTYIIDLSKKNELINKLQDKLPTNEVQEQNDSDVAQLREQKILTEEDWTIFKMKFSSIYPGFFTRIKKFKASLTEAEIRFLVLFHLDLTNKQMAKTLGISPQSVRVCKMRLKKKLQNYNYNSVEEILPFLIKQNH